MPSGRVEGGVFTGTVIAPAGVVAAVVLGSLKSRRADAATHKNALDVIHISVSGLETILRK